MGQYVIRRILWSFVMLVLVVALVFVIFFVLPGSAGATGENQKYPPVAVRIAGKQPTPATIEAIIDRLGLDRPVPIQFATYIGNAIQGDLGYSYQTQEPVTQAVLRRFPPTLSLAFGASILWLLMGCSLGVISALRRRTLLDRSTMIAALFGVSLPIFWLGLMAVFFFDSQLGIYNTGDYTSLFSNPLKWLSIMWLPWLVLAVTYAAIYSRMVRGNMLEVAGEDYIRTARAKGLRERSVIRHKLRSALTPVVTMYGLDLGLLLGGAIITESIFNIPGIGSYTVTAIAAQNLPVILGTTVIASFFIIFSNLLVDILYAVLDPRVTYS
ncbi:MAG: ABC transporter permease [Actinobacteria bacterium]|nr:ABC transporter permease [Actinomycetota bacterium]